MLLVVLLSTICIAFVTASFSSNENHGSSTEPKLISQSIDLHDIPIKVIKITKTVAIKVPVPYPVKVPHHIPFPVPVNRPIPIPVPQIVKVSHPIPVEVEKPVPYEVEQQVPIVVSKPIALPQPVPVPQPLAFTKPIFYPVPQPLPYHSDHSEQYNHYDGSQERTETDDHFQPTSHEFGNNIYHYNQFNEDDNKEVEDSELRDFRGSQPDYTTRDD